MTLFYVRAMRWTLKMNICFVNLRKKLNVRVQFKRRRPRQSLWFAMKELYSIFTGFCCFGLI